MQQSPRKVVLQLLLNSLSQKKFLKYIDKFRQFEHRVITQHIFCKFDLFLLFSSDFTRLLPSHFSDSSYPSTAFL
jgi:hypothetical protein